MKAQIGAAAALTMAAVCAAQDKQPSAPATVPSS